MLTQKQLKIFTTFANFPFRELSRQEVKGLSKEKSNNALSLAFIQFKKENLLIEKKVGKSSLFSLNLKNDATYYYLALSNEKKLKITIKPIIEDIKNEVRKTTPFFSIALFGSYVTGKIKDNSDLDIVICIENNDQLKEIQRNIKTAELKSIIELDTHIITRDDFVEMLSNDEENLGKQIAKKHLVIHNHQLFYDLIREGVQNGFNIQDLP